MQQQLDKILEGNEKILKEIQKKESFLTKSLYVLEKILIPVVLGLLVFIVNRESNEIAKTLKKAQDERFEEELKLKYFEIFYEDITSNITKKQEKGILLWQAVDPDLANKMEPFLKQNSDKPLLGVNIFIHHGGQVNRTKIISDLKELGARVTTQRGLGFEQHAYRKYFKPDLENREIIQHSVDNILRKNDYNIDNALGKTGHLSEIEKIGEWEEWILNPDGIKNGREPRGWECCDIKINWDDLDLTAGEK